MFPWVEQRWRAFVGSFDPEEASASSSPVGVFVAAGSLVTVEGVIGWVPALHAASGARFTWQSVALAALGGVLTSTAYRHHCRGAIGSTCTLLDNGCYAASLSLAALGMRGGYAIGFAVVQTLMVLAFPASAYGFSLLMALVLTLPTLVLLACFPPDTTVLLVLLASCVMSPLMMINTARRRELVHGAKRLEQALGVTNQIVDRTMQRALTTTLLNLGSFVHELRNVQTAVRLNLDILGQESLSAQQKAALGDALEAAESERALLDETMDELRRQATPRDGTVFLVSEVLERTLRGRVAGLVIEQRGSAPPFRVYGEPAHLATVLRNLLRNAAQAGATRALVVTELDASNQAVRIRLSDDGPGIPPELASKLFQPFATSGKPGGTGLGLYLCRRYMQLMQGDLSLVSSPGGGASFCLQLPGERLEAAAKPSGERVEEVAQQVAVVFDAD